MENASELMKFSVCNQDILFGHNKAKLRQLTEDSQEEHLVTAMYVANNTLGKPCVIWADQIDSLCKNFNASLKDNQAALKSLTESNQKFLSSLLQRRSSSPARSYSPPGSPGRKFDLSSVRCHGCGTLGHMIKDCVKKEVTPPPSPSRRMTSN